MRKRHHHVLRRDEIFNAEFLGVQNDLGPALVAELVANHRQFADDDFGNAFRLGENVEQVENLRHHVLVLADDLVLLEAGQALQAQLENGLRLGIGQTIALFGETELGRQAIRARGIGSCPHQHFLDHRAAPLALHQPALGIGRCRCRLDQRDDFIDIGQRNRETFEDMAAFTRLAQLEHSAPRHYFTAMRQEAFKHLLQVEQARLAVDQRHHVHAEGVLQLRLLVQIIENDFGHLATLQLDDHAHAGLVRLVANIGNTFDLLFVNQLGDLLDQGLLVNLVGNLVNDDGLTIVALFHILDMGATAHDDAATACLVTLANAHHAIDQCSSREVGRRDVLDQFINGQRRVFQQRQTTGNHFVQVVRRDIGRHADRNTGRTVDQQIGNARRHDQRLMLRAVVVRSEINCFLVEVFQQLVADLGHAHFGVPHRRGVVAIDRTEVALAIHQHVTQRKILRHADNGVIHRGIAVRVVLTDHIADDTGRFLVSFVPVVIQLVHREQNTAMYRLQAVTRIRQRPANDHAHRVIQI
ncbi:MAG: hypothetical protein ACD_10C00550G0001 [uncultured bacterium]|nr:MAG: hypothetical protein ACD_10C00550G0001 [uncultured bacterium]